MALSESKKELLKRFVDYKCESCDIETKDLDIHRIKRGWDGGKYTLNNMKVICEECHKNFHGNEFNWVKSK